MPRDFGELIVELDNGGVNRRLTDRLGEVVRAVYETGKKGEVTLTLTVKLEGEAAIVTCAVENKVPQPSLGPSLFFVKDDSLVKDDPRQMQLLKDVSAPANVRDFKPSGKE